MKVRNFYNKNQFLIWGDGIYTFQSYESTVAIIEKNGNLILGKDWNYSNTTLKHVYLFLHDYYILLNLELKDRLCRLEEKGNKKAYIQKLIDAGVIEFNKNL